MKAAWLLVLPGR